MINYDKWFGRDCLTLWWYKSVKEFFKNVNFEKKSDDDKTHAKLPNMQRVKFNYKHIDGSRLIKMQMAQVRN